MPGITPLQASLAQLVLESCLYGILLILFVSTVYFMATRRTLASDRQSTRHHFTSLVFFGLSGLFLSTTALIQALKHWITGIYQTFLIFPPDGGAVTEQAFIANPTKGGDIVGAASSLVAILLADFLVIYRLWIVWARNRGIVIFPLSCFTGVVAIVYEFVGSKSTDHEIPFLDKQELKPWVAIGSMLSLLSSLYSTSFIGWRILKFNWKTTSDSGLMFFLAILVESAALQTIWLIISAATLLAGSHVEFIATVGFPAILSISNLLIHARIGLGWSQESADAQQKRSHDI
ncbi:hypothetical protein B0H14DRAFT_2637528 [Mycena olivaceomarginata]|nr:hypothetical protein B0H14DRAFT_2637528 [Mycena olivaceomarginata]